MHILLLSQFAYPPIFGGEERHVANLSAALVARGHQVSIGTQWIPGQPSFEVVEGVQIHRLRGSMQRMSGLFSENERRHHPPFPDPELTIALNRLCHEVKPDIVHAHNWMYLSYLPIKYRVGVPLVVTLHDYSLVCPKKNYIRHDAACPGPKLTTCIPCAQQHFGKVIGAVTAMALPSFAKLTRDRVDKFLVVSKAVAQYNSLDRFGVDYDVIPNFVPDNVDVLPPADPCLAELPAEYILMVGDLIHLKGIEVLFDAYQRLPSAPPLVLIGRRFPQTPPLPPNVIHLGPWHHDAIMHAWDRCLFGVLPSIGLETFGIVIIEAAARSKTFVASRTGGMIDVIDDRRTGFLVPPGDAEALAASMVLLLTNPEARKTMGKRAREALEPLKATPVVSRIESVYSELLH